MPSSACCAISVYVVAGYRLRHFSTPRESITPPLNAVRNFDGIVSRFLASRLCSKVPVKAKAHVCSEGGGGQSIRGGGVGGAPPPRTGFAPATYPTLPHSATRNPLTPPLWRHLVTLRTGKPFKSGGYAGCGSRAVNATRRAPEPVARSCAPASARVGRCGRN